MNASQRQLKRRRSEWRQYLLTIAALLLVWLLAVIAYGQCLGGTCPPPPTWNAPASTPSASEVQVGPGISAAVCRVVNQLPGSASIGSGVLVRTGGQSAYVLTCDHLFSDGVGTVAVRFGTSAALSCTVAKRDPSNDLALLRIAPVQIRPLTFQNDARPGWATAVGLGGEGRLRALRGRIVGTSRPVGTRFPSLLIAGAVRSGDSGGPVVNDQGRLVGVVWGVRGQTSYATTGQPVSDLLATIPSESQPIANSKPNAPTQPPACRCPADCLRPRDLEGLARRDDLAGFARQSDLAAATGALGEQLSELRSQLGRGDARVESQEPMLPGVLNTTLPVLLAALGISGPLGLAWLVANLWLRRRGAKRRGSGGPRRERFQSTEQPTEPHDLPVERATGPAGSR